MILERLSLANFRGFEQLDVNDGVYPRFSGQLRGVDFIQDSFSSKSECLAQDWVQDLLDLHPGITA
jgi:hypothetical protein